MSTVTSRCSAAKTVDKGEVFKTTGCQKRSKVG